MSRHVSPALVTLLFVPAVVWAQPSETLESYRAAEARVSVVPWLTFELGTYDWVRVHREGALERIDASRLSAATLEEALRDLQRFHRVNRFGDATREALDPERMREMGRFVTSASVRLREWQAAAAARSGGGRVDPLASYRGLDGKVDLHRVSQSGLLTSPEGSLLPRAALTELQRAVIMSMGGSSSLSFNDLRTLNENVSSLLYRPRWRLASLAGQSLEELRALAVERRIPVPADADRAETLRHLTGRSAADVRTALAEVEGRTARATEGLPTGPAGFATRRPGPAVETPMVPLEQVRDVFAAAREGMARRITADVERLGRSPANAEPRAELRARLERLNAATLEVVPGRDMRAEAVGGRVVVSEGLLRELHARTHALQPSSGVLRHSLGLILAHELAHASGIASERIADAEAIEALRRSRLGGVNDLDIRRTVELFDRPSAASQSATGYLRSWAARLRDRLTHGRAAERVAEMTRVAGSGTDPDPLTRYRRADGTVDWRRATADRAFHEMGGAVRFGLALFLKELAVVAQTGDRGRIEEFFDALLTLDFYKHYGLFVLGARAGEVAYARHLERFVKPRFVNGILKTNLVLATGMALPQIVDGTFEGRTFAISLASLGLSATAVRAGVTGIRWVRELDTARRTSAVARAGAAAGRMARLGGWVYQVAELTVVLYVAEEIDRRLTAHLDDRAARAALAEAGEALMDAAGDPEASPESVAAAADAYHAAWNDYRDFLYRPLHEEEARLAARLERVAREAKLADDQRAEALERLERSPALRRTLEARHGSLEAYARSLTGDEEGEVRAAVDEALAEYSARRDELLRALYEDGRRDAPLLEGAYDLGWHLTGARDDSPDAPRSGDGFFARHTRRTSRNGFRDVLAGASGNRLETYQDEVEVLRAVRDGLSERGRGELAAALDPAVNRVTTTAALDRQLYAGDGTLPATTPAGIGLSGVVDEQVGGR